MHRFLSKIAVRLRDDKGAFRQLEGFDIVADVDNLGPWRNA